MNQSEQQKKQVQDTLEEARRVIAHVLELKESSAAGWFFEMLRKRSDAMADDILHNNKLTGDEREALRRERLGILESLRTPFDMESAQKAVIEAHERNHGPRGE